MKPTPYELASLALALYAQDHKPGEAYNLDNLTTTDYFGGALGLFVSAREYLAAREREADPPTK